MFKKMMACRPIRSAASGEGAGVDSLEPRSLLTAVISGFAEQTYASGMHEPTAMVFAPDGRIFVTEQSGAIRVVKSGSLLSTPFASVTTTDSGERGLLGIELDPNF